MSSLLSSDRWPELLTLIAALGLAAIQKGWRSFRMAQSQTWPLTYGRTLRNKVSDKNNLFRLKVFYSYRVGEESYQGEFEKTFRDEAEAQLWADALRDKQVSVHYDPENATRSRLWESDLLPIVQSLPPRERTANQHPLPAWERLLVTAGVAAALTGCGLSLLDFFGRFSGKAWFSPALSTGLFVAGLALAGLAAVERKRAATRRAAPEWVSFALHAVIYFAVLSSFLLPLGKTSGRSSRDTRDFSYQILLYFGAFEVFYVRLKDAEEEPSPRSGTFAKM